MAIESKEFRRDRERLRRSGARGAVAALDAMIARLDAGEVPPSEHSLRGELRGWRACSFHGGDWRVVYRRVGGQVEVARVGSHAQVY